MRGLACGFLPAIRTHPYRVVRFDEIEIRAHPQVRPLFPRVSAGLRKELAYGFRSKYQCLVSPHLGSLPF